MPSSEPDLDGLTPAQRRAVEAVIAHHNGPVSPDHLRNMIRLASGQVSIDQLIEERARLADENQDDPLDKQRISRKRLHQVAEQVADYREIEIRVHGWQVPRSRWVVVSGLLVASGAVGSARPRRVRHVWRRAVLMPQR